ncbi:MAG: hypothetical protein ACTSRP_23605 [Candidatus Helarchaeota archaeon]
MDEAGKFILAIILFVLAGVLILIFGVIIPSAGLGGANFGIFQFYFIIFGAVLAGIGGVVLFLRKMSIEASMRTKKVKKVKMRAISKPKRTTIKISTTTSPQTSTTSETTPSVETEEEIICLRCEFYDKYNPKQKCKYLPEKDRIEMFFNLFSNFV